MSEENEILLGRWTVLTSDSFLLHWSKPLCFKRFKEKLGYRKVVGFICTYTALATWN